MKDTIEKNAAETILQSEFEVKVGTKMYNVARASLATLIEVSKYISQLPNIEIGDEEAVLKESLAVAYKSEYMGDIVAILILGSKGIKPKTVRSSKKYFGFVPNLKMVTVYPQKELAQEIIEEVNPKELFELTITLLQKMEVTFFLTSLIFLRDVNLLRKTKI